VYTIGNDLLVMVASDRISAFDVVLKRGIPYKGQVLNQLASRFLDLTSDIVPNWKLGAPDPNVTIGLRCEPFRVEMVIRGYLTGHAWRTYKSGKRELCGIVLPDGLKEHDRLPAPIITPATKADAGHDEHQSRPEVLLTLHLQVALLGPRRGPCIPVGSPGSFDILGITIPVPTCGFHVSRSGSEGDAPRQDGPSGACGRRAAGRC
jgi:hypothetical protein